MSRLSDLLFANALGMGGGGGGGADRKTFNLTLPTTGWTKNDELNYYTQQFAVEGMLEEYDDFTDWDVVITLQMTDVEQQTALAMWANNPIVACYDGYVIVEASQVPTSQINIRGRYR